MPFNGSGGTSQPVGGAFPATASTLIESAKVNISIADIYTMLGSVLVKDGQQTITQNIPFNGKKATGLGAGATAGDALRYEQLFTATAVTLLGAMDWVKGADIASPGGGTLNLTTATGNAVHVTGTNTITAVTLGSGMWRLVIFDGILTLTHHTTNNNLPGAANITTAAGDRALYWADGTTVYCISYIRAAQAPYLAADWTPVLTFATPGDQSIAYTAQIGSYVKIGKLVTASCTISTSTFTYTTASGNLQITGLPFVSKTVTNYFAVGAATHAGLTVTGANAFVARISSNSSMVVFVVSAGGPSGGTLLTNSNTTSATNVILEFTICYEATA